MSRLLRIVCLSVRKVTLQYLVMLPVLLFAALCGNAALADQWMALGSGVSGGSVSALAVDTNTGAVYAGGSFTAAGGIANTSFIAKWDGTSWSSLGTGMNGAVNAIVVDASGNVYAAGDFTAADGVANTGYIAKWNGSAWNALGSGMNNSVKKLARDAAGNVYAAGTFTFAGGVAATAIAKWDGASWSALGTSPASAIYQMTVDSNNNVYVGRNQGYISKWDGANWTTLPHMSCSYWSYYGGGPGTTWCNSYDATVQALGADSAGQVYAWNKDLINFYPSGWYYRWTLKKWTGSVWVNIYSMPGCPTWSTAKSLLTNTAGDVYVGGRALSSSTGSSLLRFVGSASKYPGGSIGSESEYINALAMMNDGMIYIGGNFSTAGGLTVNGIALLKLYDTDADGIYDQDDSDDDNDGAIDVLDNCPSNANADQLDTDSDAQGDACDSDDDNDGLPDVMDPLPLQAKFNLNAPYKGSQIRDEAGVQ